jgi:hypothetical protein
MAGLINLNGLNSLISCSVRIQDLDPIKKLSPENSFVIAKQLLDQDGYVNRNVTYDTISSTAFEDFRTTNELNLSGTWNFSKKNFVFIDTFDSIDRANKNDSHISGDVAMNLDYLHNTLIPKIYELSAKIYGENGIVPSYVGQVITSSIFSTESQLRKVYGENTKWEQILGKFICGTGNSNSQTNSIQTYGANVGDYTIYKTENEININPRPEISVVLTKDEIPEHVHAFDAEQETLSLKWLLRFGEIFYYDRKYMTPPHGKEDNKQKGGPADRFQVKHGTMRAGSSSFENEREINMSTASFWANNTGVEPCQMSDEVWKLDSGNNKESIRGSLVSQIAHNNIPPFITKYVWKRVE